MAKVVKNNLKVGRIKMTVARAAHIQCADIIVSETALKHIYARHGMELERLGYTPLQYVKYVATQFNQIWEEGREKIIISINADTHKNCMVIELKKIQRNDKGVWIVLTAFYGKKEYFEKKKMLWQKSPLSSE